ncbi:MULTISPECIES: DUF262 domain-containing protein [unclassified Massilia]|uniref:DUF262 domain-containing protein n=1 Tax=unclassified Massilia TaxID=2609279 RepID=UPI0017833355|nr:MULTISPECIES: DUF262 domain-containing protein [unclassified Massilia]MBD8676831.1 DUF262 domain-containing protein [Massilia sp. CFBP 13721]
MTAITEQKLNPRPDFQRRMVWTNEDKLNFLFTVVHGYPFPEIYVCAGSLNPDTGAATEYLVDGQQRVTTLYQYFKGLPDLRLGKGLLPYSKLTNEEKEAFLEYEVVVRDLGKLPIEEIRRIFEIINSANYALNSIEVKNARYAGAFKKFCEGVAERQEFRDWKIFKLSDVRRMQDLRYCLVLVATFLSTYFNRDDEIQDFLERYNESFEAGESLSIEIDGTFEFIRSLTLPPTSRAFRKTDIFSLLVEVHRALYKRKVKLDKVRAADRLLKFFAEVDAVANGFRSESNEFAEMYYKSTVRAAIDRGNRFRRGEILQSILDADYAPQLKFFVPSESENEFEKAEELGEGDY